MHKLNISFINKPFGWILESIAGLVGGNFAASIFLFTLLVNLILIPLSIKSQKSSVQQTRLLTDNLDKLTLIAETLKVREVIQSDEFIALKEGRSLDELDRQRDELLQEQKGIASPEAAEEAKAPVTEDAVLAEPSAEAAESAETVQAEASVPAEPAEEPIAPEAKITPEEENK